MVSRLLVANIPWWAVKVGLIFKHFLNVNTLVLLHSSRPPFCKHYFKKRISDNFSASLFFSFDRYYRYELQVAC